MKPYGMNRALSIASPDRADIAEMGAPSRFGGLKPSAKGRVRRAQKRVARRVSRALCAE